MASEIQSLKSKINDIYIYKKKDYPLINFNGIQVESVENHKHLSLARSYKLGWLAHINALFESNDIGCMSHIMKKLKYDVD